MEGSRTRNVFDIRRFSLEILGLIFVLTLFLNYRMSVFAGRMS